MSSLLILALASTALAAPPDQAKAYGVDTICESRDDGETVEAASDLLRDDADAALDASAALLGLERLDEAPRVAITGDGVVYAARTSPLKIGYTNIELVMGYDARVNLGGGTVDVAAGAVLTASRTDDGRTLVTELTVYDADGRAGETLTAKGATSDSLALDSLIVLEGSDDTGPLVILFMYGDILMGSPPLDDFFD